MKIAEWEKWSKRKRKKRERVGKDKTAEADRRSKQYSRWIEVQREPSEQASQMVEDRRGEKSGNEALETPVLTLAPMGN